MDSDPEVSEATKIAKNVVKHAVTNQEVTMESFWEDSPCVIIFFRRFGCLFCRQSAKEISQIHPILTKNNIKFIGIGYDEFGVKDFINEGYFTGEIYLDPLKVNYKALGHKVYSYFGLIAGLLDKKLHAVYHKARSQNVNGNLLQGDPFQHGGALVVDSKLKGSKVLLAFKQDNPVDYVSNCEILKVLDISITNS